MRPTKKKHTLTHVGVPAWPCDYGVSTYVRIDGYRVGTTVRIDGFPVLAGVNHDPDWSQISSITHHFDDADPVVKYPEPKVIMQEPARHRFLWSHPPLTGLIRITVMELPPEIRHHMATWYDISVSDRDPRHFIAMLASSNPFTLTITKEIV